MRDYAVELEKRVAFIQDVLSKSGAKGIVFGNSGGQGFRPRRDPLQKGV